MIPPEDDEDLSNEDDSESVISINDPVVDAACHEDEGEEEEPKFDAEEDENLPSDKKHWRHFEWDPQLNNFRFDPINSKQVGDKDVMPTPDDWEKVHPRDMKRIKVRFDGAREVLINTMFVEYENLEKRLDKLNIKKTSAGIMGYLFGDNSRFAGAMMRSLSLSQDELDQFMATFFLAAEWGQPAKRLEQKERFVYDGCMPGDALNDIWRRIGAAGKTGAQAVHLWKDVEEALNKDCRDLFLTEADNQKLHVFIALDDDKVRFQFSNSAVRADKDYLCGIKGCQHTKSNCRGFTIDSAVSSASSFPLCFSALRQGENNTENYNRMVQHMFVNRFSVGAAIVQSLPLHGITFCSDRGYWNYALILLLLSQGAVVFGTLQRMHWLAYTYDQPVRGNKDTRERIVAKYGRSVFQAFVRIGRSMLKMLAFRSGTGAVSLAATSDCGDKDTQEFEFCFEKNGDAKWYKDRTLSQDKRNLKAFTDGIFGRDFPRPASLTQSINYHLETLAFNNVKMLNCSDHSYDWFVLRMFSFTSSATHAALRTASPYIPASNGIHTSVECILRYAGMERHLSVGLIDDNNEHSEGSSDEGEVPINGTLAASLVKSMRLATQRTANKCAREAKRIEEALNRGQLTPSTLETIMVALGFSRERAGGTELSEHDKKRKVKKWTKSIRDCASADLEEEELTTDPDNSDATSTGELSLDAKYKFPFDILSAREVTAVLLSRVGSRVISTGQVPGPICNPTRVNERRETLQWLDEHPEHIKTRNKSDQGGDDEDKPLRDAILAGAVGKAFLRPLGGNDKAASKLGHQNEARYLRQYFEDSQNGVVPGVDLCDVMRPGLAMKKDSPFIRDSADAIGFENREPSGDDMMDFDKISSHLVECKCRSGSGFDGSLSKAKSIQKKVADLKGGNAFGDIAVGRAVYVRVSSREQNKLAELIPAESERIQILHHAYTYGLDTVTYLVGDPQGSIIFGLIVTFEDNLLQSYGETLQFLYDEGLNLFYSDRIEDLPMDIIEGILHSTPALKSKFQLDDFMTSFLIWRELLPNGQGGHMFPIPKCDMLLPYEHSLWNSCKGGSDTVTRFTWNCLSVLPIKTPQTAIMARYFLIYAVLYHRVRQVVTMTKKIDVNEDTIQSVRERNNKRHSFHRSLESLSRGLLKKKIPRQGDDMPGCSAVSFEVQDPGVFDASNADTRCKVDHSIFGVAGETGVTPLGKGKVKSSLEQHSNYDDYKNRCNNCTGCPMRYYKKNAPEKVAKGEKPFIVGERNCDLCNKKAVSWICNGCKRVLCLDRDRSNQILKRLQDPKHGQELKDRFPQLSKLPRGDVPAYYNDVGLVNGNQIFVGKSCFQLAHPKHFCMPCDDEAGNHDGADDQLTAIAESAAAAAAASPIART